MNRIATIEVSFRGKNFVSEFPIDDHVKEYQIADEAYRLGILFADTQIIAKYGHRVTSNKFSEFLRDLDYNYSIKEV